jgi:FkbM family methyltransferase
VRTFQIDPNRSPAAKLLRSLGALQRIGTSLLQTGSWTYARLYVAALSRPHHAPGRFRFPFGTIQYVDIGSLPFVYYEIFVERVYSTRDLGTRPTIVDCGGNIGLGTVAFKQEYPESTVTVFEADPTIARCLEDNVRAMGYEGVTVVPAAVSTAEGSATFLADGAIGGRLSEGQQGRTIEVRTIRLADYIDGPVDLLKLDIEGAEFDVVRDLCATGRIGLIRNIVCEIHGAGATPDPAAALWMSLSEAGFHVSVTWASTIEEASDRRPRPPFHPVPAWHFRMLLYAWRSDVAR